MTQYRGRFAPSPTGPLHFGSLVAALGSYLEARHHRGTWLLRMEDLDPPREQPGAADAILRTLEACGFRWDEAVMWQSRRELAYADALDRLTRAGKVYACTCTRREIADSALARDGAAVYPGTCRAGPAPGRSRHALRLRAECGPIVFEDGLQGRIAQDIEREVGDFVLRRADGLFAYQLAVVVDDAEQGITHVVRGADLLDSTPRQILLQRLLGLPTPRYLHLPVAVDAAGEKLSKQTHATPVDARAPLPALVAALRFLGQNAPMELAHASLAEFWNWASANWNSQCVARARALPGAEV